MRAIFYVLGCAVALGLEEPAAGFDCAKAVSPAEKQVCSDSQLSELDGKLERAYRNALAATARPDALRSEQRSWLTERDRCTDVACFRHAYEQRLARLAGATAAPAAKDPVYSFTHAPWVSPRIINDLLPWASDTGDQVMAIDVTDSQTSNRYFGAIETRKLQGDQLYVYVRSKGSEPAAAESEFGYQYVGRTGSGIDVLRTMESGGGSGVFEYLLLVRLRTANDGIAREATQVDAPPSPRQIIRFKRRRLLIEKLGSITLGDRWQGELKVVGNDILIGKDTGVLSDKAESAARIVHLEYDP